MQWITRMQITAKTLDKSFRLFIGRNSIQRVAEKRRYGETKNRRNFLFIKSTVFCNDPLFKFLYPPFFTISGRYELMCAIKEISVIVKHITKKKNSLYLFFIEQCFFLRIEIHHVTILKFYDRTLNSIARIIG